MTSWIHDRQLLLVSVKAFDLAPSLPKEPLMNELEKLAQSSGAAVVVAHHFAKGDSTAEEAGDRLSGAGAWVRDPDSIVVLTPHEEPDAFTVTSILRNLPRLDDFVAKLAGEVIRESRRAHFRNR